MTSLIRTPRKWTSPIHPNLLISNSLSLIQPKVINDAFDSDFMYWAKPMSEEALNRMLANSLCFGLYDVTNPDDFKQIGFARLITDATTFAYLTDVFILPAHQGKGLGKWLVRCVQEEMDTWPELRGVILYSDEGEGPLRFYGEAMGVKPLVQGVTHKGLVLCTRRFAGSGISLQEE